MIHKKSPPFASPFSSIVTAGMPSHNIIGAHTGEHRPTRPVYDVFVPAPIPTLDLDFSDGTFAANVGPTPAFSRASAATMVDVAGNIIFGPENIFLQSMNLAIEPWATWTVGVLTPGQPDPFGGNTATLYTTSVADSYFRQSIVPPSKNTAYTYSIWLKSTGPDVNTSLVYFDAVAVLTSKPIVITNTWQRFEYTFTATSSDQLYAMLGGGSTLGAGHNILIYGAQLERSSALRHYLPTTSAPVYGPRITYDPITHECLGLLMEEQRTNYTKYSQAFDVAPWTINGGGTAVSGEVAPDGTTSASIVTALFDLSQPIVGVAGPNTISLFVRKTTGTARWIAVGFYDDAYYRSTINPTTGVVGASDAGNSCIVQDFVAYWRISVTRTIINSTFYFSAYPSWNTDGSAVNDGVTGSSVFWGAQAEAGSFPTSYIPTTTAAATRSADICSISGADFTGFYNQPEGTFVVDALCRGIGATGCAFVAEVSDGIDQNYIDVARYQPDLLSQSVLVGGLQASIVSGIQFGQPHKSAVAYAINNFMLAVDGVSIGVDISFSSPVVNRIDIGFLAAYSAFWLNGTIARLTYFPERIPDDKLIELTQL